MRSFFKSLKSIQRSDSLRDYTIRDFSGGWNVIDSDFNLSSKFSKILYNVQRGADGSLSIRPGTKWFADCSEFLDRIINMHYFNGAIYAVGENGKVVVIRADGSVFEVWSDDWASKLSGAPTGWDTTLFASFAIFNGELIICNGVNKPLLVDANGYCKYLNDPATGSNANTPICRYVVTHGRYLVMGGDPDFVSTIHISSVDTSGVWVNDAAPNDAVDIDLGSRIPSGSDVIKGLGRFRDKLVVAFEEALIPGTLGVYDTGGDHQPEFDDAIENHGSVSHRVLQTLGDDMLFADGIGVPSIRRALFTGNIQPERLSELIGPEIRESFDKIKSTATLEDRTFSVYDANAHNYMLFIPNGNTRSSTTETRCFVYKKIPELKVEAWQEYRGWNFQCGCRSALKRMFYARDDQVFIQGDDQNEIPVDFQGEQEMFSDNTAFLDGTGFSPVSDEDNGVPIKFIWELPWADSDKRVRTKHSRYLHIDAEGSARFTAMMFTDKIYNDKSDTGEQWLDDTLFDDGLGWERELLIPNLSMEFVAEEQGGYGNDGYGNQFGGGRPTATELLYAWKARFKISKLRFEGYVYRPLKFVSISMMYGTGSIRSN